MSALDALEIRVTDELERIEALPDQWLPPVSGDGVTVTICGAGLSGLGIAFGLMRRGIRDILVIDSRPEGQEGPWVTSARMKTLRSPKTLASVDLGVPSLTMRSWYEALHGVAAWEALDKPSKEDWMAYLRWFRQVTGVPVRNETHLCDVARDPSGKGLLLTLETPQGTRRMHSDRLVLATGIDGGGGPYIPPEISALPDDLYTHSADIADDEQLRGKDVVVIGGATSSFDWSVTALERGARQVTQLARGQALPRTEVLAWTNFPGFLGHFADLPDATRWRFIRRYYTFKVPPTQDQYNRAHSYPNFRFVTGTKTNKYSLEDGRVRIETAQGTFFADHLLLGTGYSHCPEIRPELRPLLAHAATWGETFTPDPGDADPALSAHPYLDQGFELTPRGPGDTWVSNVHLFNAAAVPSLGPICNGITGLKYGVPRLVDALVSHLFCDNAEIFFENLDTYDEKHFDPQGHAAHQTT